MTCFRTPSSEAPADDPSQRVWLLRWRDGPEEVSRGRNAAMAALALGYGFDDFKDLTWKERG